MNCGRETTKLLVKIYGRSDGVGRRETNMALSGVGWSLDSTKGTTMAVVFRRNKFKNMSKITILGGS